MPISLSTRNLTHLLLKLQTVFSLKGRAKVNESRSTFTDLTFESYFNYDNTFADVHKLKATLEATRFSAQGV